MAEDKKVNYTSIIRLISLFVIEILLVVLLGFIARERLDALYKQLDENKMIQTEIINLDDISLIIAEIESLSKSYIITNDSSYINELKSNKKILTLKIDKLAKLQNSASQYKKIERLKNLIDERILIAQQLIVVNQEIEDARAKEIIESGIGSNKTEAIIEIVNEIQQRGNIYFEARRSEILSSIRQINTLLVIVVTFIFFVSIFTYLYVRNLLLKLKISNEKIKEEQDKALVQERKYKKLLETSNALPWEADYKTFQFTYIGPQAKRFLGYEAEKWLEKDFWTNHIHPDDKESALAYCLETLKKEINYDFEYRMIHADGRTVWVHDIVNVEWVNNEPVYLRGFLFDISNLKEAQQVLIENSARLDLINKQIPAIIVTTDTNLNITSYLGKEISKMGMSSNLFPGKSIYEILDDPTHPGLIARKKALKGEQLSFEQTQDGIVWKSYIEPLKDEKDTIIGTIGLFVDVTRSKERENLIKNFNTAIIEFSKLELSDWNEFIEKVTEKSAKLLNVERVGIWIFSNDKNLLIAADLYKLLENIHEKEIKLDVKDFPGYFKILEKERYLVIDDTRENKTIKDFINYYLKPRGIISIIDAPIRTEASALDNYFDVNKISSLIDAPFKYSGGVTGVFTLRHVGEPRIWKQEEQDFAANVAEVISTALEAKARMEVQKKLNELLITLEEKVDERTKELSEANLLLNNEILRREKLETELKISEEKYRKLIESAGDVIYSSDTNGHFTFVNERAELLTGYKPGELIGKHFSILVLPEFRKKVNDFYKKQLSEKTQETLYNFPIITADGIEKWVEQVVTINYENEKLIGFLCIVRDVTERKNAEDKLNESENRIKMFITSAPDAVIVIDETGDIVEWNPMAEKMFGWKKEEVLKEKMHKFIVPERYKKRHQDGLKKYLETGIGPFINHTIQLEALKKDGEEFDIEINISPTKLKNQTLFVSFLRDITERKKVEEKVYSLNSKLLKANESLETSNKDLESFAYSVSHDLRAPLRAINGFTKILADDYSNKFDEEGKRLLEIVMSSAIKMGQLIDDLLSFSRSNTTSLKKSEIDMETLVMGTIAELTHSLGELKAEISYANLQPSVGDLSLIKQVVFNLISNAVKFSDKNQNPKIEIGSKTGDKEIIYYVKDNGIGFDMKYHDKLFAVFQRLHSQEEYEGTGVGLAIVKKIIERHGGRVWAESEENKGATFFFSLPISNVTSEETEKEELVNH